MKYTIHYIEKTPTTYREERRQEGNKTHIRDSLNKKKYDKILDTASSLYRNHPTLRHLLEDDAEYAEWLSQMGEDPNDQDPAIVAIRKIIRYKPLN